jgi:hypothetical protein
MLIKIAKSKSQANSRVWRNAGYCEKYDSE